MRKLLVRKLSHNSVRIVISAQYWRKSEDRTLLKIEVFDLTLDGGKASELPDYGR